MLLFTPPLLNSANIWATTKEDLQALYKCPFTGAVTIRTSLLNGFRHDSAIHQYCFFDAGSGVVITNGETAINGVKTPVSRTKLETMSSLNTLGYSPVPLHEYIDIVNEIQEEAEEGRNTATKAVIFSVTGSTEEVIQCYNLLSRKVSPEKRRWMMEINLSCPNIPNKPPPAYSREGLISYLSALQQVSMGESSTQSLAVGIKTPPYTHQAQFDDLLAALVETTSRGLRCPISFITATNTLGNCLMTDNQTQGPVLASTQGFGIGGLAGAALHPLALGNVRTIRHMLDQYPKLKDIDIIGVGGVFDGASFRRMMGVGASAVGVGTALGATGVGIFAKISEELLDTNTLLDQYLNKKNSPEAIG